MIYKLNSTMLPHLIDVQKTGHYGEDFYGGEYYQCPICGEKEVSILYRNDYKGKIVGCDECISIID